MTGNFHPSSGELLAVLRGPHPGTSTADHLDDCLACRVRLSRLREAAGIEPIDADGLRRVVEASTVLPDTIADLATVDRGTTPQPSEIWRIGRDEALLVWVRQVFDDGAVDVVPVVLDVELADEDSVLIGPAATPLGTDTAALVSLRTHVHADAFLNRIGALDITDSVNEVINAIREGRRASGIRTGPPVVDDDDQRLEYRQALRDLLAEVAPSAMPEPGGVGEPDPSRPEYDDVPTTRSDDIETIESDLVERLPGLLHRRLTGPVVHVDATVWIAGLLKVDHLDEVVVVATLQGETGARFPEIGDLAPACAKLTQIESDADSVAVSIPDREWATLLLTRADMRPALGAPEGDTVGPAAALEGYGLVDTLCKHLEGATLAWEMTETASTHVMTGLPAIAARRASESLEETVRDGARARQPAKRLSYADLPDGFDERVARFVVAVADRADVDEAMAEFIAEARGD